MKCFPSFCPTPTSPVQIASSSLYRNSYFVLIIRIDSLDSLHFLVQAEVSGAKAAQLSIIALYTIHVAQSVTLHRPIDIALQLIVWSTEPNIFRGR